MNEAAKKIDLLIPARDEEAALPALLAEIDRSLLRHILVVDNGSKDQTAAVAAGQGCRVVSCSQAGYGNACLAGIEALRQDPPDVLIFLDGDRSDHPHHIPALIAPILAGQKDLVLGSRVLGNAETGSLSIQQRFGNGLATGLMRLFWGVRYTDLGPFRAIRWTSLEAIMMCDRNFGWTIEMQIKAKTHQLRILEIPVDYRKRIGISKISGTFSGVIRAGYKILFTIFRYRFFPPKTQNAISSTPK